MTTGTVIESEHPILVVGVGSTWDGVDACRRMLCRIPRGCGIAFAVVPGLADALAREISLPVVPVTRPLRIEPDHVYVAAPGGSLIAAGHEVRPAPLPEPDEPHGAIDRLFCSLAQSHGNAAAAVVLAGYGSGGPAGLADVAEAGGLCLAQDPATAERDELPRLAIASSLVDAALAPEALAERLVEHARDRKTHALGSSRAAVRPPTSADFGRVLELLARHHGLQASDYKLGTLWRRARRRMGLVGLSEFPAYAAYLEQRPEELAALQRDLLVGVTHFFRDPAQWEHLERQIVPRLVREHGSDLRPIRIWSAGCATGEEAYGLAMIVLEQLERQGSRAGLQVFATDANAESVALARRGVYPRSIARDVPRHRLARYFVEHDDGYRIAPFVRERVTVSRHDLLADPPFSRLDLVSCRNLFIYLEAHAQQECIRRFHFALRPDGVLWLGNAEGLPPQDDSFKPIVLGHRTYQRIERHRSTGLPWGIRSTTSDSGAPASTAPAGPALAEPPSRRPIGELERFVLARKTPACVVIDGEGRVLRLFGPTERYLASPLGHARPDLLSWVGPGMHGPLRAALRRAFERSEAVELTDAHVHRGDRMVPVACTIEPMSGLTERFWLVTFHDEASSVPVRSEPTLPAEDLLVQRLLHELRVAQAELRDAHDELDHARVAHRIAYEELSSLHEELFSTTTALESSAAETQTLSDELRVASRELELRNAWLQAMNAERRALRVERTARLRNGPIAGAPRPADDRLAVLAAELVSPLAALTDELASLQHVTGDVERARAVLPTLRRQVARLATMLGAAEPSAAQSAADPSHPQPEPADDEPRP